MRTVQGTLRHLVNQKRVIGLPEGKERGKSQKNICWNYSWKCPKPEEEDIYASTGITDSQTKRSTPRCIIIKMAKVKERILKAAKEKQKIISRELS